MVFSFGYTAYKSDDGNTYSIKMRSDVAGQLGLTPMQPFPGHQLWGHRHHDLRHVRMKGETRGNYITVPIVDPTNTLWSAAPGTTLTWTDGQTYAKEGSIGERRPLVG